MATITEEIASIVAHLSPEQQRHVLTYARGLAQSSASPSSALPPGTPIRDLASFQPSLPPEAVDEMQRIIEEDCE